MSTASASRRAWILALLAVAAAAGVAAMPALTQDPAYHRFADPRRPGAGSLLSALLLYGAAKGLEAADGAIAAGSGGLVGGHALKHLAAAMACLLLVRVAREAKAS
jgi:hypothetical protein